MDINKEKTAAIPIDRCISLGLQEDPQTALGFPSIWNYCHKARPAAPVALAWQRNCCQVETYHQCPMLQENAGHRLPAEARYHAALDPSGVLRGQGLGLIILLLALLAGGLLVGWLLNTGRLQLNIAPVSVALSPTDDPPPVEQAGPVTGAVVTDTTSPTAPLAPAGSEPVALLSASPAAPSCGYQLEQTIRAGRDFIIHRVLAGENLDKFAADNKTSVEAILAANHQLPVPLRVDWVVVIPVGVTDLQGLPPFEPYFESAQGRRLTDLAAALSVEDAVLRRYNGFDQECSTLSGWFLVPRFPTP